MMPPPSQGRHQHHPPCRKAGGIIPQRRLLSALVKSALAAIGSFDGSAVAAGNAPMSIPWKVAQLDRDEALSVSGRIC